MTPPSSADLSRTAPPLPERSPERGARRARARGALLLTLLALAPWLGWGVAQSGPAFPERTEVLLTDPSGTRFVGYGIVEDRALRLSVGNDAWPERLVLTLVLPDGSVANYDTRGLAPEDLTVVIDGRARPLGDLLVGDGVALEVDRAPPAGSSARGRAGDRGGDRGPDDRAAGAESAGDERRGGRGGGDENRNADPKADGPDGGSSAGGDGRSDDRSNGRGGGRAR